VAGQQDRPQPVETASSDLGQRMERLPPGHPSSPYDEDGSRKPPVSRPADRELPLPDEEADDEPPRPYSPGNENPGQRSLDTQDSTDRERPSPENARPAPASHEQPNSRPGPAETRPAYAAHDAADSGRRPSPDSPQPDNRSWLEALPHLKEQWERHQERWPQEQRPPVDRSNDEPGSWRGDSGRHLDAGDNAKVDAACDRIAKAEDRITSRVEQTELASTGELAGKEHRLKERDRLKDKVATAREDAPGADLDRVLSNIHDAVRYTFQYKDADYAKGVISDVGQLKDQGFELIRLKNFWNNTEYRGINSQWRDGETGQFFEVQFHTAASFEAKQMTHKAYELIRNPRMADGEFDELHDYQREVSSRIPMPASASDILEYPRQEKYAR
jgi:hypothetical protein